MEGRFYITVPRIFVLHCSSRALGSAGSVRTIGLSKNGCLHTKKGVTSKAFRDSGRASFSSPLDQREDERRHCSQGCTIELSAWKCVIPLNPFPAKFRQKQTLSKFHFVKFWKTKSTMYKFRQRAIIWMVTS